jgi:hypothetical protein
MNRGGVIGVLLLTLSAVYAQQDMGIITGVISDSSGAAVPAARVTIRDTATNEIRTIETNETGAYTVGPLRIGAYEIAVEKSGFRRAVWGDIQVHSQDRVRADLQLEVGQIAETVTVTSAAPVLQVETSSLANVVGEHEIRGLPLNGRNFQQLAWLAAGVLPSTTGRDRESGFNSHGQPVTQNNFIIDGIDNNNNVMGMQDRKAQVIIPSLDAVAEFKVQTSNYSAEFGRNSGAVMIVNIKSGSNEFHGSAYEYIRNDYFDSRDTFSYTDRDGDGRADPEVLRQNQFGGTIGGPVVRNRTFFFASWEARRERRSQSDLSIVPTEDERNGIFSPVLAIIRDPQTGRPFADNRIPRERFDPVAARMLELWPAPNFGGSGTRQNYISAPPWNTDRDQLDVRIDHNVSSADRIFGRFSKSKFDTLRGAALPQPGRGDQGNDRAFDDNDARSGVFSWTRVLTPTLINEFRYGFIRQKVDKRELTDLPFSELTTKFGITGIPANDRLFGLPRFALAAPIGYTGLGEPGSMPNFKIHQVHQWLDNVSWNRGAHSFKVGLDLRWNRSDIFGGAGSHGNFQFDGQFTGNSFADFLLGLPASAMLTSQLNGQMRFQNYMFYVQDDWKVTPRFTLNVGLRYELTTPWYDKHNNMNRLEITPGPNFNTIVSAGYCGNSWSCRGLVRTDWNNWAPRLGFAWQWTPRTILRSGAGVFYGGQGSLGADGRGINNFPYNRSATRVSTPARPALQLSAGLPADFLGSTAPPASANWIVWDENISAPAVYQWNVAVQRELAPDASVTLAYVGSASNHLMDSYNWNGSPPGPAATEVQRRKLPQWNNINYFTPYAHASYHGLDVQFERRYSAGLAVSSAYTWGHSIDNIAEQFGAGGGGLQDFNNFDGSRGSSNFDVRHRWVNAVVYEIPIGKGRAIMNRGGVVNAVFGGWQLSNILSIQSGHPFSVTLTNPRQRLGATAVGTWRPDRVGSGEVDHPTADRWIDASAFLLPRNADGSFRFGNAGRSILTSDGLLNMDAGLMKVFSLTERFQLQARAEVFNLTNTPTLADPTSAFDNPDFGKVRTTISTPRQMQFALRLSF